MPARAATARPLPDRSGTDAPAPALPHTTGTRRPRLLVDAARHGMADYRRQRDLPRLIGSASGDGTVVERLCALEDRMEQARRAGDPAWSCLRHVEVLIALLSERALAAE